MARSFNGTSDDLRTSVGALSGMTYGTIAAMFKIGSLTFPTMFGLHDASPIGVCRLYYSSTLRLFNGTDIAAGPTVNTADWYVVVVRKATGSAQARWSLFNVTTEAWTHFTSAAIVDWPAPGSSGTVRCTNVATGGYMNGNLAVRAAWSNTVRWATDAAGDGQIVAAGLPYSLDAWLGAEPSALWIFDQDSTAQDVPDLTGGGANQSSVTGTTVSAESVPGLSYGASPLLSGWMPATAAAPDEGAGNSSTMKGGAIDGRP